MSRKSNRALIRSTFSALYHAFESTSDFERYHEQCIKEARQHNHFRPPSVDNYLSNPVEAEYFAVRYIFSYLERTEGHETVDAADYLHMRPSAMMAYALSRNERFARCRDKIGVELREKMRQVSTMDYVSLKNGEL